ncbi:MAG: ribonuclease Z [Salibacteraceae bacterium]|jgi:ribonuclease Z
MGFKLTVLGANSAIPIGNRLPTSQILEFNQHRYMVDCGEGAQIQVRKNKIKIQALKAIFISHLHGDHYFGIFGLLGTMNLLGRTIPLKIFAMYGLKEMVEMQMYAAHSSYSFPIEFIELTHGTSELIYEDDTLEVSTIPLSHRIPTNGFLFREKLGKRRIKKFLVEELKIPIIEINKIKEGANYTDDTGKTYSNKQLTTNPNKAWSYAFCSDTKYSEKIVPLIKNVDVLYHEATFLDSEKKRAKQTMHSTTKQAGKIAKLADVGELIIGHYSARYKELDMHLEETKSEFENAHLAIEGKQFDYL